MKRASESADSAMAPAQRLLALMADMLRELRPMGTARPIGLDDSIERDLGIDSLSRVELAGRVEAAFGVRLPDEATLRARTPRELLQAIGVAVHAPLAAPVSREPAPRGVAVAGAPDGAGTLVDVLAWHVERHPAREHMTLLEAETTVATLAYEALWNEAHAVADALVERGINRGDTIALMLPTGVDFLATFFGVVLAGAIPVPLYPPLRWSEIEAHVRGRAGILANAGARMLVTVPEARFIAALVQAELPELGMVASPGELRGDAGRRVDRAVATDDIAMLQYTSGSTGDPKGVVLTHADLLANIRAMGAAGAVTSSDRFVSWLPLYHDMGLIGAWLGSLYYAVPLTLMPPTTFLARPARWLRAIHRQGATISAAPNFAYEIAATKIPDAELAGLDLRSWRMAFNGAEPVRAATLERFAARFAPYGFARTALTPVYGLAEAAVGLTFPPLGRGPRIDRIDATRLGRDGIAAPASGAAVLEQVSSGKPLPGYEIRVVDPAGRELPPRAEGRIEFRGPSATRGYFHNREATEQLRRGAWLDTGDVGYIAEGELYVTSRIKDLIKRGGHNIHPYDLEAAVGEIPGIRKGCVAVFGTLDRASGSERVVVVAETTAADNASREALRDRIMTMSATYLDSTADDVVLVPAHTVLKTSSGKIRRSACRDLYERGALRAPRRAVWQQIARLVATAAQARVRRAAQASARLVYGVYALSAFLLVAAFGLVSLVVVPTLRARMRAARACARLLLRICGIAVRVSGHAYLRSDEATVFVANHASYVDAIVLAAVLPPNVHQAPKRDFARMSLVGYAMRRLGALFVEREDAARGIEDVAAIVDEARGGRSMLFFPEGTFTREPGLRAFRLGAFRAAAESGAPVVPVVVRGTRAILRDGHWLPTRGTVDVDVGPPLRAVGRDWSAAVQLRDRVREAMLAQSEEPDLAR